MATASSRPVMLTVRYNEQRVTLYVYPDDRADKIIEQAAEKLKESPADLQLLYQGTAVPPDATVKDALRSQVTVIHLVKATNSRHRVTTQVLINLGVNKPKEPLYAYCTECKGLVQARSSFTCRNKDCKAVNKFQRYNPAPIDYHDPELQADLLEGTCTECNGEGQPSVSFECMACGDSDDSEPVSVAPLRLIRQNNPKVRCMKCGTVPEVVVTFPCSSRHCICLKCFENLCKQGLGAGLFQEFEGVGYSVPCPGPGDDCKLSPVLDPHHFCVVDSRGPFYEKFKELSIQHFQPSGDSILCKCNTEIDPSQGKEVPVTQPQAEEAAISGLRWYQRLFSRGQPKPPAASPKRRRRTSCSKCSIMYCMECKQVWHEGNCRPVTKEMEEQEKLFSIDPEIAKDSCWPAPQSK